MYFIIIAVLVAFDQLSKYAIQANMIKGQSFAVIGDFFSLTYIHNYGAAFSILQNHRGFLILFPLVITAVVLVLIVKLRKTAHFILPLSLALIAGGGIGNLIDRIAYGYVVDFFDFKVWPIFNMADIFVCAGCGLLIIYILLIEPRAARKKRGNGN